MDRRQNNGSVKAVSHRHRAATSAQRNFCFNCRAGQTHMDNVSCTAVKEQPEVKEVQLSQPHLPADYELMLNVLRCQLTYQGQVVTNAEARFSNFFTSTETRRLVRTDSPGRPPRLSHSS